MTKDGFLEMLPAIREAARSKGYAVGLHGSLVRDYDIIACPWTEDAADANELADAIFDAANAVRWRVHPQFRNSDGKPHGRLCYAFDWDRHNYENRDYCDLSVMPRLQEGDQP